MALCDVENATREWEAKKEKEQRRKLVEWRRREEARQAWEREVEKKESWERRSVGVNIGKPRPEDVRCPPDAASSLF